MWKALIKLVESWSYRCEHDWDEVSEMDIVKEGCKNPVETRKTFMCSKCGEFKQIKL